MGHFNRPKIDWNSVVVEVHQCILHALVDLINNYGSYQNVVEPARTYIIDLAISISSAIIGDKHIICLLNNITYYRVATITLLFLPSTATSATPTRTVYFKMKTSRNGATRQFDLLPKL